MDRIARLYKCLKEAGLLAAVLGPDGTVRPTPTAIESVERGYPYESDAEKRRLAQAATLLEFAERKARGRESYNSAT